ncbi:hypothetical protein TNCV_1030071 [Trichonephila clavipes]|nr:hypothetical protein TNCV_1030071 [Trichonephila clavipes]
MVRTGACPEDPMVLGKVFEGTGVAYLYCPFSRVKSIIYTYIDKCIAVTLKTKSLGKPWQTLASVGPIPKNLEVAEAIDLFILTIGHDFLGCSVVIPGWMATTRSNALDSKNTRLTKSSVGTERLGVIWSRSQARVLDK